MYDREHPDRPAQDRRAPIPPDASRQDALARLRRERWFAANAGEDARVAELDEQIQRLSAQSAPASPVRETTSAAPVRRETAARRPVHRKK